MDWTANLLCSGLVPIGATVPVHRVVAARLPHNYFVYFFVTLLAGSVLALVLAARTPRGCCGRRTPYRCPRSVTKICCCCR